MTTPNSPLSTDDALDLAKKFLDAAKANDSDAAMTLITEGSREGATFADNDSDISDFDLQGAEADGDTIVVTALLHSEGRPSQPMPFVVVSEAGEPRIDMEKTMEKLFGFSPDQMMDAMGEAMEGMMENVGEAMADAFEGDTGSDVNSRTSIELDADPNSPNLSN